MSLQSATLVAILILLALFSVHVAHANLPETTARARLGEVRVMALLRPTLRPIAIGVRLVDQLSADYL
jgi:hypothetical protein